MTIWSGCLPPISARPFNRRSCCVPLVEEATPATPTGFHFLPPPKSLFRQGHHLTKQAKRAIIPIQKTVFQTAECGHILQTEVKSQCQYVNAISVLSVEL